MPPSAPKSAARRGPVGIVDIAHGLAEPEYGKRWTDTHADVKAMTEYERENLPLLRDVAFRLPIDVLTNRFQEAVS